MTCEAIQTGDNHLITFPEPNCEGKPTYWHASSNVQSVQHPIQSFVLSFDSDLTFIDSNKDLHLPFDMRIWGDRVHNTHEAVDLWKGEKDAHYAIGRATHLKLKNQRAVDDLRFAQLCSAKDTAACKDFLYYFCRTTAGTNSHHICGKQQRDSIHWSKFIFNTQFLIIVIGALFLIVLIQTFRLKQKSHG